MGQPHLEPRYLSKWIHKWLDDNRKQLHNTSTMLSKVRSPILSLARLEQSLTYPLLLVIFMPQALERMLGQAGVDSALVSTLPLRWFLSVGCQVAI